MEEGRGREGEKKEGRKGRVGGVASSVTRLPSAVLLHKYLERPLRGNDCAK